MSDLFGGLRSGIRMPEVVWNQGPLPSGGGLPAPLHETPDARINYNSALLGDLTPYAYGKPGYLSSQSAYLNIPHKIQKMIPMLWLPEAKPEGGELFELSHPIDDGDIAFALRLNRNSMFCTGSKSSEMRRGGLGTAVEPFVNLPTVNYILCGLQLGLNGTANNLWVELLHNLDPHRFPATPKRDFAAQPLTLRELVHIVRNCIRPFGVTRGSEKQGGQSEATLSPVSWPAGFIVSLTIDGKESNVINIWHPHDVSAGDDLVLRLKPMPVQQYTLNHYYKGFLRQSWGQIAHNVWQLVPDVFNLDGWDAKQTAQEKDSLHGIRQSLLTFDLKNDYAMHVNTGSVPYWHNLGYWHIGRSQIMSRAYGVNEYYRNDMANILKTNHLDITFQPVFCALPYVNTRRTPMGKPAVPLIGARQEIRRWAPELGLERFAWGSERASQPAVSQPSQPLIQPSQPLSQPSQPLSQPSQPLSQPSQPLSQPSQPVEPPAVSQEVPLMDTEIREEPAQQEEISLVDLDVPTPGLGAKKAGGGKGVKRRAIGGSLLKADGSSEPSMVGLL